MTGEALPNGEQLLMHIGEVTARTELSVRTLHHWEEVGLLPPSRRSEGGFRLYTEDDVQKILVIRRMKPLGFTLDEMRSVLEDVEALRADATDPDRRAQASRRVEAIRDEAARRREKLERQLARADEFIDLLNKETAHGGPTRA